MLPSEFLDAHEHDLAALLGKLVRIPTVNPPGENYAQITGCLMQEMKLSGLKVRRFEIPAALMRKTLPEAQLAYPRYNVLGVWRGRKGRGVARRKTVHFNAHYDVVPVSGTWRHGDPFSGTVSGGKIFGRGTADMKGSMASLLFALRALKATGTEPAMDIEVSFTADEETDSALGAEWLVKHAPINPDYAIVMEGGERDEICCGHNGVVWLNVKVHGRAAHGSQPARGVNALEKMAALVLELEHYKAQLLGRGFRTPEGSVLHPSINIGGVFSQGPGGKINTVPAEAVFSIDRRVLANETVASVERELRAALAAAARRVLGGCKISIERVSINHPCFSKPKHPFFLKMADAVESVRGRRPGFHVSPAFTDMQFFAHHLGIPTLGYGPGGEKCHAVDEHVLIKELLSCAKIYAKVLSGENSSE